MSNFRRPSDADQNVYFSKAMFSEAEHSRMICSPIHITTFNAGDIVPIYCREVLPYESLKIDLDFVIRQTTLLTPTMGQMHVDFYAFFVPNRVVNQSWKAVEGENFSGSWTSNSVSLAPLCYTSEGAVQIPPLSVADYYGFPTQLPLPRSVLSLCHDLKFRGYVIIWNEFFRDQNYQPPIPMSTLNVYQGFLDPHTSGGDRIGIDRLTSDFSVDIPEGTVPDGSFGAGAVMHSLHGAEVVGEKSSIATSNLLDSFSALSRPLKANKLHDYFTSVLPSPQKSQSSVFAPATGVVTIPATRVSTTSSNFVSGNQPALKFVQTGGSVGSTAAQSLAVAAGGSTDARDLLSYGSTPSGTSGPSFFPANLSTFQTEAQLTGIGISVDDLRMASAIQQVYEIQARGGSRYREIVQSFFGIIADDPYDDIPKCLGHFSRDLDLYQTAQTAPSESGSTPQGNLAAFGYTSNSGHLFEHSFFEHGYVHIFAVVRHRNIYPSYLARDNFRLNMLDFYLPPLANISEQPVYAREINPFCDRPNDGFGFQEAWAEYRYEPDLVSGDMRTTPSGVPSLSLWNYSDPFDSSLQVATGSWLRSNSEDVLNRSLAVTSDVAAQFKGQFRFIVDKTLPMPTYSVPGMDII